ncbi:MAG: molecular chaperone TorD family protein [Candidatus Omnitrophica bacterium]|nr:molecular chaperone TorD family protein [Candidatus Omnitrophota bacterium]
MSSKFEEKAGVYLLFSRLFQKAPNVSLLKEIAQKKLLTLAYHFFESTLPKEILLLEEPGCAEAAEEIAIEYTSLFVAPGNYYIPLYESFYCDTLTIDTSTADSPYFQPQGMPSGTKGFLYGFSARAVEKSYREGGLELDPKFHDLPDHIACELEFVGRLYEEGKIDLAEVFLRNHLGRWVFDFLNNVQKQCLSVFYQRVASSLNNFLTDECCIKFDQSSAAR